MKNWEYHLHEHVWAELYGRVELKQNTQHTHAEPHKYVAHST